MYKRNSQNWVKHFDFIVLDVLAQQIAFVLSYCIYYHESFVLPYASGNYQIIAVLLILIHVVFAVLFDMMHNVMKRGYYVELSQSVKHALIDFAAVTVLLFILKMSTTYSRVILTVTFALYCVISWCLRIIWKKILNHVGKRIISRTMLLVADESNVQSILRRSNAYEEMTITGVVLLNRDAEGETICGLPIVANLDDAAMYICREWVDEVFIYPNSLADIERISGNADTEPQKEVAFLNYSEEENYYGSDDLFEEETDNKIVELIQQCREMAVPLHIRLGIKGLSGKSFVEKVNGYNVLTCTVNYASPLQLLIKRLMDIVGGLIGSLIALVILLIVGPKIKRESPGPVIFKQERIGLNGKRFKLYKIRSMYMDAEERKAEFLKDNRNADGMMFKMEFDPRVIGNEILPDGTKKTGIGDYIRTHSLDEFPQFWNVLKGDMSLVGTRPPTVDEWQKYQYHHRARLSFKPGITGMWQTSGRSTITNFEEVVKLDTEYIENWSIGLDIRLLVKTIKVLFTKDGAM